ncbi:DUF397 domain-containing protein [Streptomyces huiliensis]|uniref:DUF397 domain-containing protein n=1 Tax=Streptomyces huiliensis TaxID=2876027 RepID=UPI001CBC1023|nr:DUF397 domain-containing protein [Streptomyces huiliensis]MBZ4323881.1 DUF397 domain-containing protein [Streptomyces huiliensis]
MTRTPPPARDAAAWRKSSHSDPVGAACVEASDRFADRVLIRDSKNPGRAILIFPLASWHAFTTALSRPERLRDRVFPRGDGD